ncbi:MAG: hypothetical protein COT45_01025 [bacterium (Candidatus Stahlbacteria) CG08_land_8_20_14_0_20_40_26]|nr:MAG: hypothetical protein COX49_00935 [bacterium (Candidatus Stahlbacteria) CG23_combo_of_CG06-09_8_20_14_all_40_9]PIS26309.1 MAG: hypothetical protein COT45_01025 [bacterium (Candidatus Stahlbacteria) CG08_land_8_20_14_0_20_40_26]
MKGKVAVTIVALVVLAFIAPTLAYSNEGAVKGGGGGGFMFGMNRLNLAELSTKLEAKGFEALEKNNISFGGGGYGIIGEKILLGGEGHGSQQAIFSDTLKASVSAGYGFFDVGYVLLSKKSFRLFPIVGLGGGGIDLRILERGVTPTFDEILDNPGREANISTGSILLQFGAGLDYFLKLGEDEKGEGGLLFGIRAGYTYAPTQADWKMGDMDVLGGPDIGVTGPYIHLIFGGAGFGK